MCVCCTVSDAPLDLKIKSNMVSDLFSLIGTSLFTYDNNSYDNNDLVVTAD